MPAMNVPSSEVGGRRGGAGRGGAGRGRGLDRGCALRTKYGMWRELKRYGGNKKDTKDMAGNRNIRLHSSCVDTRHHDDGRWPPPAASRMKHFLSSYGHSITPHDRCWPTLTSHDHRRFFSPSDFCRRHLYAWPIVCYRYRRRPTAQSQ